MDFPGCETKYDFGEKKPKKLQIVLSVEDP